MAVVLWEMWLRKSKNKWWGRTGWAKDTWELKEENRLGVGCKNG